MWILQIMLAVMLLARGGVAEEVAEAAVRDCECIPYYLCKDIQHYTEIDRIVDDNQCENYLDVCCKNITSELPSTSAQPPDLNNKTCGNRNLEGVGFMITGDRKNSALFGEFPWMAGVLEVQDIESKKGNESSIQKQNVYQCGGSLIHPRAVLTAAHCVSGEKGIPLIIRAGEWDAQTKNELYGHQDRDVERIVIHEDYKDEEHFNDVALLFLSKPVLPEENIGFACLPTQGFSSAPGTHCVASGWGKDKNGKEGRYSAILKKVDLPLVDNQQCETLLQNTSLGQNFKLHESFICAGGDKGNSTCKGDGGSPLVCPLKNNPTKYIQSGIVSWRNGCGEDKIPGIYVDVADFRSWIDSKMSEEGYETSYYTY